MPVGSSVTVYVSTGSPQVTVPDLTNDTQAGRQQPPSRRSAWSAASRTMPVSIAAQDGIVQSQSPQGGATVNKGSTVNVVIGSYTPPTTYHHAVNDHDDGADHIHDRVADGPHDAST